MDPFPVTEVRPISDCLVASHSPLFLVVEHICVGVVAACGKHENFTSFLRAGESIGWDLIEGIADGADILVDTRVKRVGRHGSGADGKEIGEDDDDERRKDVVEGSHHDGWSLVR